MEGNTLEKLLPNSIYNVVIKVTDINGVEYINPNYRNFKIENPTKLIIENQAFFSLRFKTSMDTFHTTETKLYSFNISIKENIYPVMYYEYALDWEKYDTLKFNGKKGRDGMET